MNTSFSHLIFIFKKSTQIKRFCYNGVLNVINFLFYNINICLLMILWKKISLYEDIGVYYVMILFWLLDFVEMPELILWGYRSKIEDLQPSLSLLKRLADFKINGFSKKRDKNKRCLIIKNSLSLVQTPNLRSQSLFTMTLIFDSTDERFLRLDI